MRRGKAQRNLPSFDQNRVSMYIHELELVLWRPVEACQGLTISTVLSLCQSNVSHTGRKCELGRIFCREMARRRSNATYLYFLKWIFINLSVRWDVSVDGWCDPPPLECLSSQNLIRFRTKQTWDSENFKFKFDIYYESFVWTVQVPLLIFINEHKFWKLISQ